MREWSWISIVCCTALVVHLPRALAEESGKAEKKTISLTVDYGDGVQKSFTSLEWKPKQTVFDALGLAAKHPRGIKFKHRGSGETTLVTEIDDVANRREGNSWLYEVNDKLADRSCGVYELKAGDSVLWKFGNYR